MWTASLPTPAYQTLGNLAPRGDNPRRYPRDADDPGAARPAPEGIASATPIGFSTRSACGSRSASTHQLHRDASEIVPQAQVLDSLRLFAAEVMPSSGTQPDAVRNADVDALAVGDRWSRPGRPKH